MASPLRVFISATSQDLKPAAEKAASVLRSACQRKAEIHLMADLGFYKGTITSKLEEEIKDADVIVHIVGMRYGIAPMNPFRSPAGYPCSYTQMEYWIAKQHGKLTPVILCSDDFPYAKVNSVERDVEVRCQHDHRRYLDNAEFEKIAVSDMHQFELAMHVIGHTLLWQIAEEWRQRWLNIKRTVVGCVVAMAVAGSVLPLLLRTPAPIPAQSGNVPKLEDGPGPTAKPEPSVQRVDEGGLIGSVGKRQKIPEKPKE